MTLAERCASLYGPRPVQVFDPDADPSAARERRFLIAQAMNRSDRLLQIQIIYLCGLAFGWLIAPPVLILSAYGLMQLSEAHAAIVFRRLIRDAQNPEASLAPHRGPVARYELGSAAAISLSLLLAYLITDDRWSMGILALWGMGASYFVPSNKHDALTLFGSLGIMIGTMVAVVFLRSHQMGDFSLAAIGPPLALVLFAAATSLSTGVNARQEHFRRLDHEEVLEHAAAKINAESQAKSVLLAQLSHEIRTPLNGVLGAAELMAAKDLPHDQRVLVDIMREGGGNLVALLDRMMDISAAEVGAISIRRAPAVLTKVLEDEIALFDSRAREAGIDLIMQDDVCSRPRQIDAVRVRQCVANLISNAIDHSGGDRVAVSCAEAGEQNVAITIADNGDGVPAHRRKLIFQPFGDKGLEGPYSGQGAGLGLALSRSIARSMGGDLKLSDSEGGGSTFILSFEAPLI